MRGVECCGAAKSAGAPGVVSLGRGGKRAVLGAAALAFCPTPSVIVLDGSHLEIAMTSFIHIAFQNDVVDICHDQREKDMLLRPIQQSKVFRGRQS